MFATILSSAKTDQWTDGQKGVIAFLFDGEQLVDATHPARTLLRAGDKRSSDFEALIGILAPRFPNLRECLRALSDMGEIVVEPCDGGQGQVLAEQWNGITRISLTAESSSSAANVAEDLVSHAIRDEVESLRAMADDSPQLMWREDASGAIIWANAAFMSMSERCSDQGAQEWPPAPLFADLPQMHEGDATRTSRQALMPIHATEPRWFDVTSKISGGQPLHVAQDVTAMVHADDTQRELQQTLTKTFAGLAIGMAVFDHDRRLVLFNPALGDLTRLRAAELVSRPRIDSFLDLLRENRILPEPRDYAAWRRKMSALEAASAKGDYVESWNLFDGRTFRVTGRPFPNGAIALFFEDVTTAVEMRNQLRTAVRLGQDALDGVSDAIAVFSKHGDMVMANVAYRKMWGANGQIHDHSDLETQCALWKEDCIDTGLWDNLVAQLGQTRGPRIRFKASRIDGRPVNVIARHLSDGNMAISFTTDATDGFDPQDLRSSHINTARA